MAHAPDAGPPGHVLLGELGRAHGLRGEVRLKSYTGDPLAIGRYGPLVDGRGRAIVLSSIRLAPGPQPDLLIARVEGAGTREAAEALNRTRLFAPRERLGPTADDEEFFLVDLVGLEALDASGAVLGRVSDVPNYGGGDMVEIAPGGGRPSILVPFTRACVPRVDVAGGRITVALPVETEDGSVPPDDQSATE